MKRIILGLFIIKSISLHAEVVPVMDGGEVKILYPCSLISTLDLKNEKDEIITFFEKGERGLSDLGLILRHRSSEEREDFTAKFRHPKNESIKVDEILYSKLHQSKNGELKCEVDVNYHPVSPVSVPSCSFKTTGKKLEDEHFDFMKMVGVSLELSDLRKVEVKSTSWKLDITNSYFKKKPSVERWRFRNECLLEISARFDRNPQRAMGELKNLIRGTPSPIQGSKTSRALGI